MQEQYEILQKEKEVLEHVNMNLEKDLIEKPSPLIKQAQMNDQSTNKMEINTQANAKRDNYNMEQQNGNHSFTEQKQRPINEQIDKTKRITNGTLTNRNVTEQNREERGDNNKKCYACGESNHEIRDCNRKQNIYVTYKGRNWINKIP